MENIGQMAKAVEPFFGQFFCGILYSDEDLFQKVVAAFEENYSSVDLFSVVVPFSHTSYYEDMGENLKKRFISFENILPRESIVEMKLFTNDIEIDFSPQNERIINIDPGYMTLSNVFLASCKDFYHRMYLSKGIFLENEYRYVNKKYEFWPWTYPDYQKEEYLEYFYELRALYNKKLKLL